MTTRPRCSILPSRPVPSSRSSWCTGKIRDTLAALPSSRQAQRFALNVLIGFLPAVAGPGVWQGHQGAPVYAAGGGQYLHSGRLCHLWAERRSPAATRVTSVDDMSALDALKVGLVQCLAMVPGTSRSGATIIGGMLLGLTQGGDRLLLLSWPCPPDRRGRLQPVQGARAAVCGDAPLFAGPAVFLLSAWSACALAARYISSHSFVPLPGTASCLAWWFL